MFGARQFVHVYELYCKGNGRVIVIILTEALNNGLNILKVPESTDCNGCLSWSPGKLSLLSTEPEPAGDEVIPKIGRAGMSAPCAANWRFSVSVSPGPGA